MKKRGNWHWHASSRTTIFLMQDSHARPKPAKEMTKDEFHFFFLLEDINSLGLFSLIDCPNIISVITDEELIDYM